MRIQEFLTSLPRMLSVLTVRAGSGVFLLEKSWKPGEIARNCARQGVLRVDGAVGPGLRCFIFENTGYFDSGWALVIPNRDRARAIY